MAKEALQEALKKLEQIVSELSAKDVHVDEGLEKFREGAELIKFCRAELKKSENEFSKLKSELNAEEDERAWRAYVILLHFDHVLLLDVFHTGYPQWWGCTLDMGTVP